tara:strand:+ start:727 stop:1320 length:594 start_codon:yes stop_codon:yes gene_type:complete
MKSKTKYIKLFEAFSKTKITIFDIDDTLVITKALIRVKDNKTGKEFTLTPEEFNKYEQEPHHEIDYSDFDDADILKAGRLVEWVLNILIETYKKERAVGIITARANKAAIMEFLAYHGLRINPGFVFAVNDPSSEFTGNIAERKVQAFEKFIEMGYTEFKFFDDDKKNIQSAKELEKTHGINMKAKLITPGWYRKLK